MIFYSLPIQEATGRITQADASEERSGEQALLAV